MKPPIRVLIVDDSAVVRQVVSEALGRDPAIQVMATAADPLIAMQRMQHEWPDVILLDIEMPRMDGITFLKKLMAERPTPVVICSALTEKGARSTMDAMAAGALSVVTKPQLGLKEFLVGAAHDISRAIKAAAGARMGAPRKVGLSAPTMRPRDLNATSTRSLTPAPAAKPAGAATNSRSLAPGPAGRAASGVVALGTSTGGTQALETVLTALPRGCPGLVIVQHMPATFTAAFAARLDRLCQIDVKEAQHGDAVLPGRALIAPGGLHMQLRRQGMRYSVDVVEGPPVKRHCPSVDVLFRSTAKWAGSSATGIIMTGMGDDGALGLLEMRAAGARTLAQDEASCVVYGMPKEAVRCGAVQKSVALDAIAAEILAGPATAQR